MSRCIDVFALGLKANETKYSQYGDRYGVNPFGTIYDPINKTWLGGGLIAQLDAIMGYVPFASKDKYDYAIFRPGKYNRMATWEGYPNWLTLKKTINVSDSNPAFPLLQVTGFITDVPQRGIAWRAKSYDFADKLCKLLTEQLESMKAYKEALDSEFATRTPDGWDWTHTTSWTTIVDLKAQIEADLTATAGIVKNIFETLVVLDPGWNASDHPSIASLAYDERKRKISQSISKLKSFFCGLFSALGIDFGFCGGAPIKGNIDTNMILMLVVIGVVALLLLSRRQ